MKKTEYITTTNQAAKGGKEKNRQKSNNLTVTGYIVRNGTSIKRTDLSIEEQQRLAETWSIRAMNAAGYTSVQNLEGEVIL